MYRGKYIYALVCFFIVMFFTVLPQTVFAHATLLQATPSPDSQLQQSPQEIALTFNERLENELYYIKVFNPAGDDVTQNSRAQISEDQHTLRLALPKLQNGAFTISYQVISADGHPVRGSYVLRIGELASSQTGGTHQSLHGDTNATNGNALPMYFTRIVYYVALLLLAGCLFWASFSHLHTADIKQDYRKWGTRLQIFHAVALVSMILLQYIAVSTGGSVDLLNLLAGTTIGMSWIISAILAVGGFFLLFREKWLNLLWVLLLLIVKTINGHAVAFDNPLRTVLLDIVHLAAASVWAGGLLVAVLFWRKHREYVSTFLPVFSKWAFMSIVTLAVSGTLSTLMFVPKLEYLLLTQWGKLLLAKVALVVFVIITGGVLRYLMRKQDAKTQLLVKIDFGLMLGIIGIVGILTYSNPLPANEPLYWHQMGRTLHMTTEITPKAPGSNNFTVKIWMPDKGVKPKQLQLLLKNTEKADVAPIQVPLQQALRQAPPIFPGFIEYDYQSVGPYLPFAGSWTVELRVMDTDDNETVYSKDISVY